MGVEQQDRKLESEQKRHTARMGIFVLAASILLLLAPSRAGSAQERTADRIRALGSAFQVEIRLGERVADTWNLVQYVTEYTDADAALYLDLLQGQLARYPKGYLKKAHAGTLVLGKDLAFQGQLRAAVPDPYRGVLYLSMNGAYGTGGTGYLEHVFNHELHHCVEHALWGSMTWRWPEWARLNPAGFQYGSGGESAYQELSIDWQALSLPREGFVSLYATTAEWEDRAEIAAALMGEDSRGTLSAMLPRDGVLKRKVELLVSVLKRFAGAGAGWLKESP
jgi:hypothetical protein